MKKRGQAILNDPLLNKGTAFTAKERDALGLAGLLPHRIETQDQQLERVFSNCARKPNDLERYIFLMSLQDQNEALFYRTVLSDLQRFMPIIYTPTVGEAALHYGAIFRRPRGLYVTAQDRGRVREVLQNWGGDAPSVIVATDGGRILGLGDLGANGMSISVGKLALYTAAGGIHPGSTLPIVIDVGTNTERLLSSPHYLGLRQKRIVGEAYQDLMDEFVEAVGEVFPDAMLQFEDFATENAITHLARYRDQSAIFNDDIQGTAGVTLAGILAALRITDGALEDQRVLFVGAGSANIGIGELVASAIAEKGMSLDAARKQLWFMDRKGLIVEGRDAINSFAAPYAHAHSPIGDIATAIEVLRPTILIGATGQPGIFDEPVVAAMAKVNARPVIFALSNPTSRSEATAEDVYLWSQGKAVFASGSPFGPVTVNDETHVPGQSNNVYIFPGIGLGVTSCKISRVTDTMFRAAARAVASGVSEDALKEGRIFPALDEIRTASLDIAVAIAEIAFTEGLAGISRPDDLRGFIAERMYSPRY
ncbi:NAD-dependent malic enzyme [Octadecabacter temperatus]|nr:NAD-dependent malic enzyme [Octadecabacter temperatus]